MQSFNLHILCLIEVKQLRHEGQLSLPCVYYVFSDVLNMLLQLYDLVHLFVYVFHHVDIPKLLVSEFLGHICYRLEHQLSLLLNGLALQEHLVDVVHMGTEQAITTFVHFVSNVSLLLFGQILNHASCSSALRCLSALLMICFFLFLVFVFFLR